jgi:hypothetical protein
MSFWSTKIKIKKIASDNMSSGIICHLLQMTHEQLPVKLLIRVI